MRATAGSEVTIEIPTDVAYVAVVRDVVSAAAGLEENLDSDRVNDLALAVTEATINAIGAHRRAGSVTPVRVRYRAADGKVTVTITDEGSGFEPTDVPRLPRPESPERLQHESGLGLHLIEMLSDELQIRSGPQGTTVQISVYGNRPRLHSAQGPKPAVPN